MSNVLLNAGSGGATLGTDQVAGSPNVDYQIVKIGFSAAGAAPVQVQTGNPLPVVQTGALPAGANVIGAVTQSGGPWTGNLTQLAGTAVDTNSGLKSAGTLRVVLVTDQPSLTNALPVAQSGTWNITNISGTVSLPTGAATAAKQPALGTAGAASADVISIQGIASMTPVKVDGSAVTQPVSGTVTTTPPANASSNVAQINGVAPLMGNGVTGTGSLRVTVASDNTAFTVNAAQSGVFTVQPGNTPNSTPWLVQDVPGATNGCSRNYQIAPATPAKTVVKASAGTLYAIKGFNNNATPVFIKLFDAVTGSVTLGTTACDDQFEIPGNTAGAGFVMNIDKGVAFATGIIAAITNLISSTDSTAITANSVIVTLYYK